jgi:hypothetical protein
LRVWIRYTQCAILRTCSKPRQQPLQQRVQ